MKGSPRALQTQIPSARQTNLRANVFDSESILKGLDYWSKPFVCILVNNNDLAPYVSNLIHYRYKKALEFFGPAACAEDQRKHSLGRCVYNTCCANALGRRGRCGQKDRSILSWLQSASESNLDSISSRAMRFC